MKLIMMLFLMLFSTKGYAAQSPMPIRPVTIKVVDMETKKPLEGVPVFYALETMVIQKYVFFVIPNIEPEVGSKLGYKRRATTNKNGEVMFHVDDFKIPQNERFVGEMFFINIDADMTSRMANISRRSLEDYYSTGKTKRDGEVDNIDLVRDYILMKSRDERDEVLFKPEPNYGGAVVISMSYPQSRQEGTDNDRYDSEENLSLIWGGDTLDMSEDLIVVSLQRGKRGIEGID